MKGIWWFCAVVCAVACLGCGDGRPKRVPIAGKVMIDGKPLERGFIQVVSADNRPATGEIGRDGSFRLTTFDDNDGCVLGNHKVTVIANENQGPYALKWHAPKEYSDVATSDVMLDVTGPREDVVIELSWKGGAPFVEKFENEGTPPPAVSEAPATAN